VTTLREFAERVLFADRLEDKLAPPPAGLIDTERGSPLDTPAAPGRPASLRLAPAGGERAEFPREHQLGQEQARGHLLHFLANHELLATELMALALLKFPEAPPAFRRGLLHTLAEEQRHTQWYLDRMAAYGVGFGELPVNGFFWNAVAGMATPMDYVTRLPLTFEQANLDFSLHYRDVFRRAGDEQAAALFQTIHDDEISHVAYGLNWFRKWKEPDEPDWTGFARRLVFPLSPVRAKARRLLDHDGRRQAGLEPEFIRELDLYGGSRGRTPVVYLFNPQAETTVRGGTPDRPILRLAEDLDLLPAFLAHQEDVVLVRRRPRPEFLEKLRRLGMAWPELEALGPNGHIVPESPLLGRKLGGLRPWAWSPDSESVLGGLRASVGGSTPAGGWHPAQRDLFSKACGADLLRALGDPLAGRTVTTLADLRAAMSELHAAGHLHGVVKPAFGSSGRGFRRTERWVPADDAWAEQALADHGALVVEPWLDRLADFSVQSVACPDGTIQLKGFTRLVTDERGRFLATEASGRFARLFPSEIARFFSGGGRGTWLDSWYYERVFPLLARRFAACGFQGDFGIDALVHRQPDGSPALRPVVELNPRFTMGRVALELRRRAHSTAVVRFSLATLRSARTVSVRTLPELASLLENSDPPRLVTQGASTVLAAGTTILNDPELAQRFLAVLTVRPTGRPDHGGPMA
jgi:uncharacterized ferritin-like protein (DUF455 family)